MFYMGFGACVVPKSQVVVFYVGCVVVFANLSYFTWMWMLSCSLRSQLVAFYVDFDCVFVQIAVLCMRLNIFDSFVVCYFIAMCICVVLIGPLFCLFHFVFLRFASLRLA